MSLTPKTDTYPACLGIACPRHARCTRWHAVHGSEADPSTLDTCATGDDVPAYPEFVQIQREPLVDLAAKAGHA